MQKLDRTQLYSLEKYSEIRPQMRARVMEHKKNRRLPIGPNATLYFEDRETIQDQVQEMLRGEKVFEAAGIEEFRVSLALMSSFESAISRLPSSSGLSA